jgi:arabinofuranosyltransferase
VVVVLAGAWTYRWVQDDAFINFRIIANLLAGHGPVFNVGERVEAYSDPLWVFLLASLHEVLPFISLEWLSVVLGLVGTGVGVILGGRAIQRLGASRGSDLVIPIGLLIFSVVAGVWEFSTSGLEMGMVFGWIGLVFWLLVRTESRRTSALWCAFTAGLGALIRPELILMSGVFLVSLGLVVAAPGWRGPRSVWRRYLLPLLAALCLPLLYELWRMAYFALVVSNTALAKSAGASWWLQGFTYLWNFVSPYTLWLPFVLVVPLTVPRIRRWWRTGDRTGAVVLLTPVVAALADLLSVVHVGGDYMHARLLLPAFLALCLALFAEISQLRTLLVVPLVGIVIWAVVCAGWLRWDTGNGVFFINHGIQNERNLVIGATHNPHPVTWTNSVSGSTDPYAMMAATAAEHGRQEVFVLESIAASLGPVLPAKSSLPFHLAVNVTNIGFVGVESGPDVYIFDSQSLANPIGSHTTVGALRLGGKIIGPVWMIGRFGLPGEQFPTSVASLQSIDAARRALTCAPLSSYLRAITAPLSFSQALSDIAHSFTYTTMTFSGDPTIAERQLCGHHETTSK